MFEFLNDPTTYVALITLVVMEIVLGIDNLIFISILSNKLPKEQQKRARQIGIGAALLLRLGLLFTISIIVKLTAPVFSVFNHAFSWRDMILIAGGVFLLWKATKEIIHVTKPEQPQTKTVTEVVSLTMGAAIFQILLLDLVFSIDSIITAVGMTDEIGIMVIAVVAAVLTMLFAAEPLSQFIEKHPTVVMLALGFLLIIGATLVAEGFGIHVEKGYVYTAMAFSGFIEILNIFARKRKSGLK
jgi:predicted tellurium resistance membrane protein TerC